MEDNRTFFVTSVAAQRCAIFRCDATARLFAETLLDYRAQGKYQLHEFVIMPDHFHLLLTSADPFSVERAVQFIKGGFSFRLHSARPVWQPSFTNHRIRDKRDYEHHRGYLLRNPVRAGLAARPEDYPYCSAAIAGGLDPVPPGLKADVVECLTRP